MAALQTKRRCNSQPAAVVTCPLANMIACLSNGLSVDRRQPDGGIYSGTGVTSNVFDPTGRRKITITYTYTDSRLASCIATHFVVEPVPVLMLRPSRIAALTSPLRSRYSASGGWPVTVKTPISINGNCSTTSSRYLDINEKRVSYQPRAGAPGTYIHRGGQISIFR